MTTALEAAEAGHDVILVEREPAIGGRVVRNHQYFPKLCPPLCGMEINTGRLDRNERIRLLTSSEVTSAERIDEGWTVEIRQAPEHVNGRCTACGDCTKVCPATTPDRFNYAMSEGPAIRPLHTEAYPARYTLDRAACPADCRACVDACKYDAIDLEAQPTDQTIDVGAVVLATGWDPYPLEKLSELGGGELADVIANVHLERMVATSGPSEGKILRPSNGEPPKRVAFVQCAGSRDTNHLPYCSAVCCLASYKQATYVRDQLPDAEVAIYYIDRRAPGRNEEMLKQAEELESVDLVKGKVGRIEAGDGGVLKLRVEDIDSGRLLEAEADLVVLATGMVPRVDQDGAPFGAQLDDYGFGLDDKDAKVFVAGVSRRPEDVAASVRNATGTAAKAIVAALRSA